MSNMNKPLIFIGSGGHAHVLADIAILNKRKVLGYLSQNLESMNTLFDFPLLGNDEAILNYQSSEVLLVNGLGFLPGNNKRSEIYSEMKKKGYEFSEMIHPSVILPSKYRISNGVQIMAGVIIQSGVMIGSNTIINSGVILDHDSNIGENCHLAPGTVCGGNVKIGNNSFIGAGSIVINNINIGNNCIAAAGSVIFNDIPADIKFIQKK